MAKVDVKALLEAGVHFGHRTEKWNPKMKPFIYEARNGIYVINLVKTAEQLEAACAFLKSVAASGGKVLFVGCKKQSQEIIKELAGKSGSFHVTERWLGGTLTNLNTIRKSVGRMRAIDELEKSGKILEMPKQEASALRRENLKIHRNLDGVADMEKIPAAMVVVDTVREEIAVREARRLNIPVVAINDTNSDPDQVDYPIPGNDDAIRSIRAILEYLNEAIIEGNGETAKRRGETSKPAAAEMAAVSA
jgi:small subunit ribosomal protein S2